MADLTITAANVVLSSGSSSSALAGETITAGQAVYQNSATLAVWKAQCDGTAAEATAVGVALNGGGAGQPIAYALPGSTINIGATTVKTSTYHLSATAGGVCPEADLVSTNKRTRIGYATATTGTFVVDIANNVCTI